MNKAQNNDCCSSACGVIRFIIRSSLDANGDRGSCDAAADDDNDDVDNLNI